MKKLFSMENSLEALAALITAGLVLGVLQTFIIGKHFVIPTMVLLMTIFFGNLARFGLRGERWAKHMLFWVFMLMVAHTFFALFWAGAARPGALFGAAFYPLYGGFFAVVGFLCWRYASLNKLF